MNEVDASDDFQSQENQITFEPDLEETLAKMLAMMQSKLDGPPASKHVDLPYRLLQALSFSGMAEEALSKLNIQLGGSLKLKTDYKVRVAATEQLGMTEHWSSEGLYRHLCVLQKLVPRANEAKMKQARVPGSCLDRYLLSRICNDATRQVVGFQRRAEHPSNNWQTF